MDIDNRFRTELKLFPIRGKARTASYAVYTYLLVNASYCNGNKTKRGEILTSVHSISAELDISENRVRTILDNLIAARLITKKATRNYTIYTLLHYDGRGSKKPDKKRSSDSKSERALTADEQRIIEVSKRLFEALTRIIVRQDISKEESLFFDRYIFSQDKDKDKDKAKAAADILKAASDYNDYLRKEIQHRELTEYERDFFNSYFG